MGEPAKRGLKFKHLQARHDAFDKMRHHVGESPMGDYLCVGGKRIWLGVSETLRVIKTLTEMTQEEQMKLKEAGQ